MSIATALTALADDVTAARAAVTAKGGTVTPDGGTSQLADDIGTIPSGGAEITDGIVIKSRDANGEATEIDIYGTIIYPFTMGASVGDTYGWFGRKVTKANLKSEVTEIKTSSGGISPFTFAALEEISVPSTCHKFGGNTFRSLSNLKNVEIKGSVSFTANNGNYMFYGNKNTLETVVLGSIGEKITTTRNDVFNGQYPNLTLTIFTDGSNADNCLTKFRQGATNATIIIKASEDTTYNGVSYAAGDTMITSEVA